MYTFVETRLFTRLVDEYLTDEEFAALQIYLIVNPHAGKVIKGSGGVRKLRWPGIGHGKRGGVRILYFLRLQHGEIWLLTMYPKNVRDCIPTAVLKRIREEIDGSSQAQHRRRDS